MREERSRLRTQVYILEKERAASEAQQQQTSSPTSARLPNQAVSAYTRLSSLLQRVYM